MKQNLFNSHGQPFSKKQKKASRMMMKSRFNFIPKDPMKPEEKLKAKLGLMQGISKIFAKVKGGRR